MSTQQSQQQQSSQRGISSSKNVCVITNGDSILGYALAYRFLEAMQNREDPEIQGHKLRLLVRQTHGLGLKKLEEMGAEIQEINYKDEDKLRHALKNVRSVCLIPENSSDRLKEAENLIKAAKHEQVEHLGVMSCVGVDRMHKQQQQDNNNNDQQNELFAGTSISEYRNLKEFYEIEKMAKEQFSGDKHCIIRHQLFMQFFYFLAPQIEGENVLPLPVKKNSKWGAVNLVDVVEGIYRLARKHHEEGRNSSKKNIYEFTAPKTWSSEEMAREIGEGLGRQGMRFKEISGDEFKKHLERVKEDKRFKERPDTKGDFREGRDGWWSIPLGQYLNKQSIECIMEYLCLACKGQLDCHSDDLKHVLERNPLTLKEYFKVNRDCFKKFK